MDTYYAVLVMSMILEVMKLFFAVLEMSFNSRYEYKILDLESSKQNLISGILQMLNPVHPYQQHEVKWATLTTHHNTTKPTSRVEAEVKHTQC